jgi:hypothetical protein
MIVRSEPLFSQDNGQRKWHFIASVDEKTGVHVHFIVLIGSELKKPELFAHNFATYGAYL